MTSTDLLEVDPNTPGDHAMAAANMSGQSTKRTRADKSPDDQANTRRRVRLSATAPDSINDNAIRDTIIVNPSISNSYRKSAELSVPSSPSSCSRDGDDSATLRLSETDLLYAGDLEEQHLATRVAPDLESGKWLSEHTVSGILNFLSGSLGFSARTIRIIGGKMSQFSRELELLSTSHPLFFAVVAKSHWFGVALEVDTDELTDKEVLRISSMDSLGPEHARPLRPASASPLSTSRRGNKRKAPTAHAQEHARKEYTAQTVHRIAQEAKKTCNFEKIEQSIISVPQQDKIHECGVFTLVSLCRLIAYRDAGDRAERMQRAIDGSVSRALFRILSCSDQPGIEDVVRTLLDVAAYCGANEGKTVENDDFDIDDFEEQYNAHKQFIQNITLLLHRVQSHAQMLTDGFHRVQNELKCATNGVVRDMMNLRISKAENLEAVEQQMRVIQKMDCEIDILERQIRPIYGEQRKATPLGSDDELRLYKVVLTRMQVAKQAARRDQHYYASLWRNMNRLSKTPELYTSLTQKLSDEREAAQNYLSKLLQWASRMREEDKALSDAADGQRKEIEEQMLREAERAARAASEERKAREAEKAARQRVEKLDTDRMARAARTRKLEEWIAETWIPDP